ncbi:MAG: lysophospholipid acyltransferase family protein [Flavobacteriales bacterium]|nr:lysophospholipid acyltransferase family protein [Flavobacteriales bacterium]
MSYLPHRVLYIFSDFLYLVIYKLIGYRQEVVRGNLKNSFPDKDLSDIKSIEKKFYMHFCDLIVESIKMFSLTTAELNKRAILLNAEVVDEYFEKGQSILITGGHYQNWEMNGCILGQQLKHDVVGIYTPMSNSFFNEKFLESRGKFGIDLLSNRQVRLGLEGNKDRITATIFATDQSPTHSKKVYWTRFLNQETAILIGTEKFSREYNYPVVFISVSKVRRGYYEMRAEVLVHDPSQMKEGEISEIHTRRLEKDILNAPQFWLWTHKRWKRKRKPDEIPGRVT